VKLLDLITLVQWLKEADIHAFELEEQGTSLRIVMQRQLQPEAIRVKESVLPATLPKRRSHHVVADAKGIFLTAHPLRAASLVAAGDVVAVGDVLGLLRVTDVVYKAVLADRQGRVVRTLAADGQLIEEGMPLFELDVGKSCDLTSLRKKHGTSRHQFRHG
jgi:acetyl-CoA carboxylase biotin carboxyl carrier protein